MRFGGWVESSIIWAVRGLLALLMLPMILVYAAVVCLGGLGVRAISAVQSAARRPEMAPGVTPARLA